MKSNKWVRLGMLLAIALIAVACGPKPDRAESEIVRRQQELYLQSQPPPFFDWSLERHLMSELYRARNSAVSTFSLTWDSFRGKMSWSCPSIGYPIPGGTQLTNPQQELWGEVLPQAEPNGMFSPTAAAGTYVMCANPDGTVSPVFIEDNVRTYTQPMMEVNGQLVPVPESVPTLRIDPTNPTS